MARLEKLEKILFYVFLFLIPFQIRAVISWGGNEWNSVFVYLGDIILFLIFLLAVKRLKINKFQISMPTGRQANFKFQKTNLLLIIFLIIAGFSLLVSSNLEIGLFRFIKLAEFILLFLYIKNATLITNHTRMTRILQIVIAGGLLQSALAIAQFFKQSSLGLKFIEAGVFKPGAPGVATFIMENGEKVMRAYGSFPHPNVLAGFILLTIFCLYQLLIGNSKSEARNPKQIQNQKSKFQNFILPIFLFVLIFALFLTFSRAGILVFVVGSLAMLIVRMFSKLRIVRIQTIKLFGLFFLSCLISIAILFPYLQARFFEISFEEQAIDLRFFYNKMALQMIKQKPLLGIGIGNFVWHSQNYPAYLRAAEKMLETDPSYVPTDVGTSEEKIPNWIFQPVHNIYLLIGAEIGIVGLIVFIAILITNCIRMIRKVNPFFFLIVGFLLLGLTDHYFWTIQQGGIMFWLSLALARPD